MSRSKTNKETDGAYFLKLVMYVILGSQWLWFTNGDGVVTFGFPAGLAIGIVFASHEHFQIDRKIEYALILIAMLIGFWSQLGVYINL